MSAWEPVVGEVLGRFATATNITLLGLAGGDLIVYKPTAGNRPLRDFDVSTLADREVLAYRVSLAMGIDLVPETALGDGPLGPGAIQRFVEADEEFDPLGPVRSADPRLWPVAVFDIVTNNADRKLGHILGDRRDRLWAIDHGLTFHPQAKLRTVLWGFAGAPVPDWLLEPLDRLHRALDDTLGDEIASRLGVAEAFALRSRVEALLDDPLHPEPPDDRPAVPWPP